MQHIWYNKSYSTATYVVAFTVLMNYELVSLGEVILMETQLSRCRFSTQGRKYNENYDVLTF
jgi:hypothetical protein